MTQRRRKINKKYIVAITGASGSIYAKRLVESLSVTGVKIFLVFSDAGLDIFEKELAVKLPKNGKLKEFFKDYFENENLEYFENINLHASISSGSFKTDGMVVIPASMGSVARIACGISSNLIERSADVILKEKRKLVIVPRETPLSVIHLENMLKIAKLGGIILPAMPAFYTNPESIDELVNFVAGRVLDSLDITDHNLYARWS
ncbi:MAG: flavin prenyltransferase UbiX, partial [bacterium]